MNTEETSSTDVSLTIQEPERVSENSSPDTIEMLYIESSNIGLVEFRKRVEQESIKALNSEFVVLTETPLDQLIWYIVKKRLKLAAQLDKEQD